MGIRANPRNTLHLCPIRRVPARSADVTPVLGNNCSVRFVLTATHEPPRRPPLVVCPGDCVRVGERDDDWPEFVFVTTAAGAGWVPARFIEIEGDRGTVKVAYDTAELAAAKGQLVEMIHDDPESGWDWCQDAQGTQGWLPHRVLKTA